MTDRTAASSHATPIGEEGFPSHESLNFALTALDVAVNMLKQRGYQDDSSTLNNLSIARGWLRECVDAALALSSESTATTCIGMHELQQVPERSPVVSQESGSQPAAPFVSSAGRTITEPMVEAAAQRMVALVMGGIIERPQLVQWQQWSGSARSILEAALEQAPQSATTARSAEKELLDKCIMALSGQYVNDEDKMDEKEAWNSAVGYCIGSLRCIQETLVDVPDSSTKGPR